TFIFATGTSFAVNLPSLIAAPPGWLFPSTGMKVMRPSSIGWPSNVTSPLTVPTAGPVEQPPHATSSNVRTRAPHDPRKWKIIKISLRAFPLRMELEITECFAAIDAAQGLPCGQGNVVRDEPHRAVGHRN